MGSKCSNCFFFVDRMGFLKTEQKGVIALLYYTYLVHPLLYLLFYTMTCSISGRVHVTIAFFLSFFFSYYLHNLCTHFNCKTRFPRPFRGEPDLNCLTSASS